MLLTDAWLIAIVWGYFKQNQHSLDLDNSMNNRNMQINVTK